MTRHTVLEAKRRCDWNMTDSASRVAEPLTTSVGRFVVMGWVMISCAVTGQAVSTGITTDQFALDRAQPFTAWARCSACGGEHAWSKSDAWLCEAEPPETSRAA